MSRRIRNEEIERCLLENELNFEDEAIEAEIDCESDHCSVVSEWQSEADASSEEDDENTFSAIRAHSGGEFHTNQGVTLTRVRDHSRSVLTARSQGVSRIRSQTSRGASRSRILSQISRSFSPQQASNERNNFSLSPQTTDCEQEDRSLSTVSQLCNQASSSRFFTAKDGTQWFKLPHRPNVRQRDENIIRNTPGVKPYLQDKKTHLECFDAFITETIMNAVLIHTNEKISTTALLENSNEANLDSTRCEVTRVELKALIGLLFLAGLYRSGRQNTEDIWATDGTGIDIFRLTVSRNRFMFLLSKLRFDDMYSRVERAKRDKLAPIREIFEYFVSNCQNSFTPYEYLTLDEELVAFRGRCPFRQYIPSKPAKYGIKIYALVENRTYFTCNLEIYCGKQPENGPFTVINKPHDLVKRMVNCVSETSRNITMDNYFTSYNTTVNLLENHKLTVVGTLRANKTCIPHQFKTRRKEYTSLFGFQEKVTLVSYVPKPRKMVYLMSSMHHDSAIDAETGVQQKPEIITFYNATKSGVDVVDKLARTYDVSRNSKHWPLTIFFSMLNHAGINAMVMYMLNNGVDKNKSDYRRQFLKKLGLSLIAEHQKNRKENERLPRDLRKRIAEHLGEPLSPPKKSKKPNSRQRCAHCPRSKDRKSTRACKKCDTPLCLEHSLYVCENCADML